MLNNLLIKLIGLDSLAKIMLMLVVFIGACVAAFATRYMRGDSRYGVFFRQLVLLILCVCMMVSADNLVWFFISWCASNFVLVRLMIHKKSWRAALASGRLATNYYLFAAGCVSLAFTIFYLVSDTMSIQKLTQDTTVSYAVHFALVLLLFGAMTQSAIWPLHRWLLSSLNSPTPVSAIMHAGLVNGGGIILIRFAPLYLQSGWLLTAIFTIGMISALIGTLWKLMQSDIKRMLACSTLGQMGFMLVQCGLGLFPAAVAHIVWHGMFKAYLFLGSGNAAHEKRYMHDSAITLGKALIALFSGIIASITFSVVSHKYWAMDTTAVLLWVTLLAGSQFALTLTAIVQMHFAPLIILGSAVAGALYGYSVHVVAWIMQPMQLMQPQKLNAIHISGIVALTAAWFFMLVFMYARKNIEGKSFWHKMYVFNLNASQPHPATVTAYRNNYQYI